MTRLINTAVTHYEKAASTYVLLQLRLPERATTVATAVAIKHIHLHENTQLNLPDLLLASRSRHTDEWPFGWPRWKATHMSAADTEHYTADR